MRHIAYFRRALAAPEALFEREEVLAFRSAFAALLHNPHERRPATEVLVDLLAEFGEAAKAFFQNILIFAQLSFAAFPTPEDGSEPRREGQSLPPGKSFSPWADDFYTSNHKSISVRICELAKLHLPVSHDPRPIQ